MLKIMTSKHEKSANDLKTIINTYVESVLVPEDKVDINLILFFVHLNGGGEAKP
jgi:site-specific DNA recombinase